MQSLYGRIRVFARHNINNLKIVNPISNSGFELSELAPKFYSSSSMVLRKKFGTNDAAPFFRPTNLASSYIRTLNYSSESVSKDSPITESEVAPPPPRIKFKRLDKTAKHIMQILDKEAVAEVRGQREIPDIKPGYIIQLKVEVPENKRRNSLVKGIVIARRNAGLNSTIRLRRMVAGVGVESLLPLYSPNIKEIKILDKKKVRRAKLYYLRDKLNPLKK